MPALAAPLSHSSANARHLLIPYAASLSPACQAALPGLQLPNLTRLLACLSASEQDCDPPDEAHPLTMPHERALARARGLRVGVGPTPWAALALLDSGALQEPQARRAAWAWITPCHWQVGMDNVTLDNPAALALTEAESRALIAAMAPYFSEDGLELSYQSSDRWLARGELFRDLATVSLDRVIGQNISGWLQASGTPAPLRRLQSEMQMLLYMHPINDARVARKQIPVNAFWVSGAGALPLSAGVPSAPPTAWTQLNIAMPDALREAALREDWATWRSAWQNIDANECAQLLAALEQTGQARLTLCSERSAHTFAARPRSLLARSLAFFHRPSAITTLQAL